MIIAIDTSYLCYKFLYANKESKTPKNSLKWLMITLVDLSMSFRDKKVQFVFCFDSKISKRKELDPTYKEKRAEQRKQLSEEELEALKEMYEDLKELKSLLPQFGFSNILFQEGYESDDLFAQLCNQFSSETIFIVANDKDLYQLIDKNVSIITTKNNSFEIFTLRRFIDEYNCSPKEWLRAKYLWGCHSDNIPPIQTGIGEKTAIKYIKNELKTSSKAYSSIVSSLNSTRHNLNKKLITLPYEGTEEIKLSNDNYNYEVIEKTLSELFPDMWEERKTDFYNFCKKVKINNY